jgi:hypothetical protein
MTEGETTAVRVEWAGLPQTVRREIEQRLGTRICAAETRPRGYTHGVAARLSSETGATVFIKAIPVDDPLAQAYRTEAATTPYLPRTIKVPSLRFVLDTAAWFVLAFDDIDGTIPRFGQPTELTSVLAVIEHLARTLTPNPVPGVPTVADCYGPHLNRWREFAARSPPVCLDDWSKRNLDRLADLETSWPDWTDGDTLLHTDLRPDNMLIDNNADVWVVDWSSPLPRSALGRPRRTGALDRHRGRRPRSDPRRTSRHPWNRRGSDQRLCLRTRGILGAQQPAARTSALATTPGPSTTMGSGHHTVASQTVGVDLDADRVHRRASGGSNRSLWATPRPLTATTVPQCVQVPEAVGPILRYRTRRPRA